MAITQFDNTYFTYKMTVDTDLGSATSQNVTNGPATLYSLTVDNTGNNSAISFLKIYDSLPDGGIVANSTEPDYIFPIDANAKRLINFPTGLVISTGLSLRCITSAQTNQTTDPSSNVSVVAVYKT